MTTASTPVRVAIVDDHPMFRMGLAAALREMNGIEFVGEAERADQVATLVADASPAVMLLDLHLPDGSGLDVAGWLARYHPDVRVVILTMSEDLEPALTALGLGVRGYLVKGAGPERVEHAIRTVASGDVVIDLALVKAGSDLVDARALPKRPFPQLTDREFHVLELIAAGLDNTTIANNLVVSPKTVRNHVSNVFAKIHARDRSEAIVLAHRHGVGTS